MASVEAYGINVMSLTRKCDIPYYNGENTVSYVALILFNNNAGLLFARPDTFPYQLFTSYSDSI